jgi:Retron-type reverse transcriptase
VLLGVGRRSTSNGRNLMSDTRSAGKPFDIPKALVWNAYQKVKANKGAAGVDGQSLAEFAQDEKDNLYKLWNRLSSGSYFPPPVRAVEIPKRGGRRKDSRGTLCRRQDRPDCGGDSTESWSGSCLPSGFLRLSPGAVCAGRGRVVQTALLAAPMGDRS